MKVFRITFVDGDGKIVYGCYIVAPTIERAIELTPGKVADISERGECIAIHKAEKLVSGGVRKISFRNLIGD